MGVARFIVLGAWLLGLGWTEHAFAQVAVLQPHDSPPRTALVESLRIQLGPNVPVIDAGPLAAGTPSERIEQALGAAELHNASAAVWVEGPLGRSDGSRELVLYVVGRREDRALVDVLHVPTTDATLTDLDIDRSLALKVRQVLADLGHSDAILQADIAAPFDDARAQDSANSAHTTTWHGWLTVGGVVRSAMGSVSPQLGLRTSVGAALQRDGQRMELLLRTHLWPRFGVTRGGDRVTAHELTPAIEVAWCAELGRLCLGARGAFALRLLDVNGTSGAGNRGDDRAFIPSVALGPNLSARVIPGLWLSAGLELDLSLQRLRYAVNDTPLLDTGRLALLAHVGLAVHTP